MSIQRTLRGVFAAAITPILADGSIDASAVPEYLEYLYQQGCHGALLLGTTGEGPSLSPQERMAVIQAAMSIRTHRADFTLLAGTGTPSLEETIDLTRAAFEVGIDGVVVLPPYYYRKADEDGLFNWYVKLIQKAVPEGKQLLVYHIPAMSGINLSLPFLQRLKEAYPFQFAGLKDSSGDADFARQLGEAFGDELTIFTGSDRLFGHALRHSASGCITAGANLFANLLRRLWEDHLNKLPNPALENQITQARDILDQNPPASALIKGCLPRLTNFPRWAVKPPGLPLGDQQINLACQQLVEICGTKTV
ncbi:MAG: dihydrodipicolinate synthase family protein [Chloroflexota bacterium]